MGLLGDPDAVHRLAVAYAARAEVVAEVGRAFEQRAQQAVWEGGKARRFRADADALRRDCLRQAAAMRGIADDLLRLEGRIREQMRQLEALERRVRGFLDAAVPEFDLAGLRIPKPWEHLPWNRHNLPGRHSPDWELVVQQLRRAGAPV